MRVSIVLPVIHFALIVALAAVLSQPDVFAHEGETHAEPESTPVALVGSDKISVSGRGDTFEVVLKYFPFEKGSDVPLTAYVLDIATNEPVSGAKMTGTLSTGAESHDVTFAELAAGLTGSYAASIKVEGGEKLSWLFDIAAGDKTDLVAVDGFKLGEGVLTADAHENMVHGQPFLELTRLQTVFTAVVLVLIFAVLLRVARRQPKAEKGADA
jgi:hypothetical protein